MALPGVPTHELFANSFLLEGEIADTLRDEWNVQPRDVTALLSEKPRDTRQRMLKSLLSGPIDIDKMDYLGRDSLHAGVPYGRNFDQQRLIGSLCLNQAGDGLAISHKGRTAAEMMVFARYVMFSEVYWHHAVRSATAMLQRAFYLLHGQLDLDQLFRLTGAGVHRAARRRSRRCSPRANCSAACSARRAGSTSGWPSSATFSTASGTSGSPGSRIPGWCAASEAFAAAASQRLGRRIAPHEILFDAPPVQPRSRVPRRGLLPQGKRLSHAGRSLARRPHAGHAAVRRLRQAGPHLRAPDRRWQSWPSSRRWTELLRETLTGLG